MGKGFNVTPSHLPVGLIEWEVRFSEYTEPSCSLLWWLSSSQGQHGEKEIGKPPNLSLSLRDIFL